MAPRKNTLILRSDSSILSLRTDSSKLEAGSELSCLRPTSFPFSLRWLDKWLDGRFALRGVLNIAMEAFEEFCRAKTNFYIFEKVGEGNDDTTASEAATESTRQRAKPAVRIRKSKNSEQVQ